MGIIPYGVLGQGSFQTEEAFKEREKGHDGRNFIPTSQRDKDVSKVLENIAKQKGVELLQVALAYIINKAPYVFPLIGARKVSHIEGSIDGLGVTLTDGEIKEIESVYDFDFGFPHSFLSGTLFDHSKSRGAEHSSEVGMLNALGNFDWVEKAKAIGSKKD